MSGTDADCVRDALLSDADDIAHVHVDAWRETYSGVLADHHFSEDSLTRRKQFWSEHLALNPRPGRMVVARRGGVTVGFATSGEASGPDAEHGFPPARPLQLFTIYLLASAHGSGLGQKMLDAVLGNSPAQLWVLRGNDRAISFYTRNGFTVDGVEFADASDPNRVEVRMVR